MPPPDNNNATASTAMETASSTPALHKLAVVQGRWDPHARAYLERRQAEGKTRLEALRCLKRLLARVVFRLLRQTPTRYPERVVKVRGGKVRVAAVA